MAEVNMKNIVGETFEDMSIAEMTMVQGSGDVETETLSLLTVSAAVTGAAASWAFSVGVVKTVKGHC
jgi:type 2 lantibiotic (TIGR03893 family)